MDIKNLSQVSIQERRRLPATSGVYLVLNCNNEVLYVGRSKNLKRRWQSHHLRHQDWTIAYLEAPISSLRELETELIQNFLPRLNTQHCYSVYWILSYRQRLLSLLTKDKSNHSSLESIKQG